MDLQIAKKKIRIQVSKANRKITSGKKKKNTPLTPSSRNIVKYLVKKKSGEDNTNNGRKPSIVEDNVKSYKTRTTRSHVAACVPRKSSKG